MMTIIKKGKTSFSLSNGEHSIIADVARSLGGEDEGLNPHELIEGALGACTALTLEMYAKRKNWDVKDLRVEVKILKEGTETLIERKLFFGDMPADVQEKLRDIANKCPIHKLLESHIKIENL